MAIRSNSSLSRRSSSTSIPVTAPRFQILCVARSVPQNLDYGRRDGHSTSTSRGRCCFLRTGGILESGINNGCLPRSEEINLLFARREFKIVLRIVVQRVRDRRGNAYRLIAYDSGTTYRPVEFASLDDLLRAMHSVVPNLDESALSIEQNGQDTSIVLTGTIELDNTQLSALGLKTKSGRTE
jgi:hypothetical protein